MHTAGGVVTKLRTARACHHCKVYREARSVPAMRVAGRGPYATAPPPDVARK
jgi:hypothetical protein